MVHGTIALQSRGLLMLPLYRSTSTYCVPEFEQRYQDCIIIANMAKSWRLPPQEISQLLTELSRGPLWKEERIVSIFTTALVQRKSLSKVIQEMER